MKQAEGPRQSVMVVLIVTLVFALASAGAFAVAWMMSRAGPSASTGVGVLFAFGWFMATIAAVAVLALRHGDMRGARIRTDGPRARGDAYFEMGSRMPAFFMGCSALLLLVAALLLLGGGQTTPLGAGIAAVLAIFLGSGARSLWPRPDKTLPPA